MLKNKQMFKTKSKMFKMSYLVRWVPRIDQLSCFGAAAFDLFVALVHVFKGKHWEKEEK